MQAKQNFYHPDINPITPAAIANKMLTAFTMINPLRDSAKRGKVP
jgi:hypothetical protein